MPPMERRTLLQGISAAGLVHALTHMAQAQQGGAEQSEAASGGSGPVYELRVYHAAEGKLEPLLARFRDHTVALFSRHGLRSVAYWTPTDEPLAGRTLYYILAHPSREAARANWKAFSSDPEWIAVKKASEVNGSLTDKIDSTFLSLTDFSPKI